MRYLQSVVQKDLQKKMVFLGGPRQVGKTTLAQAILKTMPTDAGGVYLNWDDENDKRSILKREWSDRDRLLVFDELHKFPRWKNWIKGIYDKEKHRHSILVTGSARLDIYRRGGDSLMGRYHYWRLHPMSLSEFPRTLSKNEALKRLMAVGGFPEPFLDNNETEARRWRKERMDRIVRDDIRDLEPIRQIQTMSLFLDLLRNRVGGMVVLSNLASELQVSPRTVGNWLEIFEKMYLCFAVRPYTKNLPRAIQKPPKVYFYDNADVIGDEGQRFENLVATHLLKTLHFLEDSQGYRCELRYVRDKEGREVDFVIVKEGNIEMLVEAKLSDHHPSPALMYFCDKLKVPLALQIVYRLKRAQTYGRLHVVDSFEAFTRGDQLYHRESLLSDLNRKK
jgi:predicted AAA+ superfamily ATPase